MIPDISDRSSDSEGVVFLWKSKSEGRRHTEWSVLLISADAATGQFLKMTRLRHRLLLDHTQLKDGRLEDTK